MALKDATNVLAMAVWTEKYLRCFHVAWPLSSKDVDHLSLCTIKTPFYAVNIYIYKNGKPVGNRAFTKVRYIRPSYDLIGGVSPSTGAKFLMPRDVKDLEEALGKLGEGLEAASGSGDGRFWSTGRVGKPEYGSYMLGVAFGVPQELRKALSDLKSTAMDAMMWLGTDQLKENDRQYVVEVAYHEDYTVEDGKGDRLLVPFYIAVRDPDGKPRYIWALDWDEYAVRVAEKLASEGQARVEYSDDALKQIVLQSAALDYFKTAVNHSVDEVDGKYVLKLKIHLPAYLVENNAAKKGFPSGIDFLVELIKWIANIFYYDYTLNELGKGEILYPEYVRDRGARPR